MKEKLRKTSRSVIHRLMMVIYQKKHTSFKEKKCPCGKKIGYYPKAKIKKKFCSLKCAYKWRKNGQK